MSEHLIKALEEVRLQKPTHETFQQAIETANTAIEAGEKDAIDTALAQLVKALDAAIQIDRRTLPDGNGNIECSLGHLNTLGEPFCDECGEVLMRAGQDQPVSPFLFIHDFFRDGRRDALAEVAILQHCGEWTKEKRAAWLKEAVAAHARARHTHPHLPQGRSYYAGRIAGLKSAATADYSAPQKKTGGKILDLTLSDSRPVFCGNCVDPASWKCTPSGTRSSIWYRCDPCKQEVERLQTYRAPDGWDWNEHEGLVQQGDLGTKLVVQEDTGVFFPVVLAVGFLFLTLTMPLLVLVIHLPLPAVLGLLFLLITRGKELRNLCSRGQREWRYWLGCPLDKEHDLLQQLIEEALPPSS